MKIIFNPHRSEKVLESLKNSYKNLFMKIQDTTLRNFEEFTRNRSTELPICWDICWAYVIQKNAYIYGCLKYILFLISYSAKNICILHLLVFPQVLKYFTIKNISLLLSLYYMHLLPKNLVRQVCICNAGAAYEQKSPLRSSHIISVCYTWGIHIIGMHWNGIGINSINEHA